MIWKVTRKTHWPSACGTQGTLRHGKNKSQRRFQYSLRIFCFSPFFNARHLALDSRAEFLQRGHAHEVKLQASHRSHHRVEKPEKKQAQVGLHRQFASAIGKASSCAFARTRHLQPPLKLRDQFPSPQFAHFEALRFGIGGGNDRQSAPSGQKSTVIFS